MLILVLFGALLVKTGYYKKKAALLIIVQNSFTCLNQYVEENDINKTKQTLI